jgi:hypothetical protein
LSDQCLSAAQQHIEFVEKAWPRKVLLHDVVKRLLT